MRHPYSKFLLLFLVISCLFCSCQNESKVFVGQWQDERSPENVWEIKKSGSTFTGTRISGDDFYKYDTEQWKFELRSNGCLLYTSPSPRDATLSRMPSSA